MVVINGRSNRNPLVVSYGGSSSYGAGSSASLPMPPAAQQILQDSQVAMMERRRKKRERERERRKKRKIMNPKFWSKNMDPEVWGNLPPNLALEIYKRLPMQSFYRLREVCKDWNLVARERRCVTDPIHKPYLVLIHEGEDEFQRFVDEETDDEDMDDEEMDNEEFDSWEEDYDDCYLHGILTFHIKSGGWRWQKLHTIPVNHKLLYKPFSVKGLTFSRRNRRSYQVFDAHTREMYTIPQQPKLSKMSRALGMAVDTSVVPHTFKIIIGSLDVGTQIYDSVTKSWETRSSLLVPCEEPKFKSCLQCGDYLYIWSQDDQILVYSLEKDTWSTMNPPRYKRHLNDPVIWMRECLGSWDGRIFAVTSDAHARLCPSLCIWELVDQGEQMYWKSVDEMPRDVQCRVIPSRLHVYNDVQVFASFCDELVMIYSWVPEERRAYRFVLYNLVTKEWEKVEAPNYPVSIYSDDEKDNKKWDVEDRCSMLLEAGLMDGMIPGMNYCCEEHRRGSGDDSDVDYSVWEDFW